MTATDGFFRTELAEQLADLDVDTIIVTGIGTDFCVAMTRQLAPWLVRVPAGRRRLCRRLPDDVERPPAAPRTSMRPRPRSSSPARRALRCGGAKGPGADAVPRPRAVWRRL